MPAVNISATPIASSDALNSTGLPAADAIGAAFCISGRAGEVQTNLAAAYLAVATQLYGRTATNYFFVHEFIGETVDDPLAVLTYLLACEAASTCNLNMPPMRCSDILSRTPLCYSTKSLVFVRAR